VGQPLAYLLPMSLESRCPSEHDRNEVVGTWPYTSTCSSWNFSCKRRIVFCISKSELLVEVPMLLAPDNEVLVAGDVGDCGAVR
jgi:hypothetical protein